jgi:dihydropteroate synthase
MILIIPTKPNPPEPGVRGPVYAFKPPLLMGVVNVTPDSFSDGGRYLDHDRAVEHAMRLADEGADIVDIGGESTRPPGKDYGEGSAAVNEEEELERVMPVIERLHAERPELAISIDTMKPAVARSAVAAGASIINDVSAGRYDPGIWKAAAELDIPYILMHGHDPANPVRTGATDYADVVADVYLFLHERIEASRRAGVRQVIADVGIGFAKGAAENERLIREHARFLALGVPMLLGASRKAFIGRALGGVPPEERLYGTLGAHAAAALNGASILRVHDVRPAREFFTLLARTLGPADPSATM